LDAFDWEKIPQTLANFTTVITRAISFSRKAEDARVSG
jgi:hypothetical protein